MRKRICQNKCFSQVPDLNNHPYCGAYVNQKLETIDVGISYQAFVCTTIIFDDSLLHLAKLEQVRLCARLHGLF